MCPYVCVCVCVCVMHSHRATGIGYGNALVRGGGRGVDLPEILHR